MKTLLCSLAPTYICILIPSDVTRMIIVGFFLTRRACMHVHVRLCGSPAKYLHEPVMYCISSSKKDERGRSDGRQHGRRTNYPCTYVDESKSRCVWYN